MKLIILIALITVVSAFWCDVDPNLEPEHCEERTTNDQDYNQANGDNDPNNDPSCGVANIGETSNYDEKIINGEAASPGQFPWLVAVGDIFGGQACGGSLINKQWVLTAGHCFNTTVYPCEYMVRVGEHNLHSDVEKHQDVLATDVIRHPGYDGSDLVPNDIALMKLAHPVDVSVTTVNTLCLPGPNDEPPVGTNCIVAGWGDQQNGAENYSSVVNFVEMPLLDPLEDCANYVDKYGDGVLDTSQMLCAGYPEGGIDTCQGDSGGPLFCRENDDSPYIQIGVVSNGEECALEDWPGIYTRVPNYVRWINDVISRYS